MTDLVTLGETMAVLTTPEVGPLRTMASLRLGTAGSESNVAIGIRRLGHEAAWIGRVGDDELGRMILARLRSEGVGVESVHVDEHAQTAIMLKERRTADVTRVTYYRKGYAGSRLAPGDLDETLIARSRILHVTGITAALGATALAAIWRAVEIARSNGVLVTLDVNYRAALWSRSDASEELRPLAASADVVFAGADELTLLEDDPEMLAAARSLAATSGCDVVVKLGGEGAMAVAGGETYWQRPAAVRVVDPVGAGDAFVAGYLSALLDGLDVPGRLTRGAVTGAFAVTVYGDWEGLPRREELGLLDLAEGETLR